MGEGEDNFVFFLQVLHVWGLTFTCFGISYSLFIEFGVIGRGGISREANIPQMGA